MPDMGLSRMYHSDIAHVRVAGCPTPHGCGFCAPGADESPELQGLLLPMRGDPGLEENRKQSDDQNAGENYP